MPSKNQTISVRLDPAAKRRVERAAEILHQSSGAFLGAVGEERAYHTLRTWAADRYRRQEASLSELAADTGLPIEDIVLALQTTQDDGLEVFLNACRTIAETQGNPQFLRLGEEAVRSVRREQQQT